MVLVIFFLIISGLYQSFDLDGVQIIILFMMGNFYVMMLQILWRFTGEENTNDIEKAEGSFESIKEKLGLNYFDKETDIEFSRSNSSDKNGDGKREYVEFDDDQEGKGRFLEEEVQFGNKSLDQTKLSEEEQFEKGNGNNQNDFGKIV